MSWLIRVFGRSLVWKLGAIAAVALVAGIKTCYAQTVECATACTVTVVHELSLPPLQLDTQAGIEIAGAVLLVWVVGWAFRTIIRTLKTIDEEKTDDTA